MEPKTFWQEVKFPFLIFNPGNVQEEKQGKNLFLLSSLSNSIISQPRFDLVIGNPPFKSAKTGTLEDEYKNYSKRFGFAQEKALLFLHRATEFCKDSGKMVLLSTSKILFNKSGGYTKFRNFLFNENLAHYLTKKNGWLKGVGFQFLTNAEIDPKIDDEIPHFKFIEAKDIRKYRTSPEGKLRFD